MHLAENRTSGNLRVSLVDDTVVLDSHQPEFCQYSSQFSGHYDLVLGGLCSKVSAVGMVKGDLIPEMNGDVSFSLLERFCGRLK